METTTRASRFEGVDLLRGFAAFGVVVIHANLVVSSQMTVAGQHFTSFFISFAVPFFLATAFYFAALSATRGRGSGQWRNRADRLLVPYIFWTAIYCSAKFFVSGTSAIGNPLSVLFQGGNAAALYFLPLLVVGLVVLDVLREPLSQMPVWQLAVSFICATVLSEAVARSGNGFNLFKCLAFEPLLARLTGEHLKTAAPVQFCCIIFAHAIRCLSFVALTFLWLKLSPATRSQWAISIAIAAVFFIAGSIARMPVPESLMGFGALIPTLAIRFRGARIKRWALRIGAYSFGVFLAHQVFLEIEKLALNKHLPQPAGIAIIVAISMTACLLTALVIWLLDATGSPWLRKAFGLPA